MLGYWPNFPKLKLCYFTGFCNLGYFTKFFKIVLSTVARDVHYIVGVKGLENTVKRSLQVNNFNFLLERMLVWQSL